jgi:two-component system, OmpR family, phosphate regulon sensor histidine kinase PhoR
MLSSTKLFQQTQSQLDHSRLLSLINSLSDGFMAIDENGVIELSNSVALNLLDTNALDGKNIAQAMPLTDKAGSVHNIIELAKASGPSLVSRDYKLKYTDGTMLNLYLNVSMVRAAFGGTGKAGHVVLFRDITKEKLAEEERDEFISVASHELRNPVAIAEGGISNAILLSERAQLPGNIQEVLKSAHEQIIFLGSMINDLAMISRADREKFTKAAEEFDPAEVIASLQKDYSAQAQKKGLDIRAETSSLPRIYGSKLYTREILQNFVTNALKYTEKGGIFIKGSAAGDGVDLSVTDTGIGIEDQEQAKLFTKFFRSDDSRVRQINGTGLGLYVSAKLAKLMSGQISMKSEYNKGSTFTLHLPSNFTNVPPAAKPVA